MIKVQGKSLDLATLGGEVVEWGLIWHWKFNLCLWSSQKNGRQIENFTNQNIYFWQRIVILSTKLYVLRVQKYRRIQH